MMGEGIGFYFDRVGVWKHILDLYCFSGAGGGGAGGVGGSMAPGNGFGGPGVLSNITGTELYFAGGGGGGNSDGVANMGVSTVFVITDTTNFFLCFFFFSPTLRRNITEYKLW